MQNFTVSVVIPVYNRAKIVHQSIDSVLNQSGNFHVEIIIVDDYSDDRIELIEVIDKIRGKIKDDRFSISLILHEANRHGGAARNTGVKNASGRFIAFLDSDDTWVQDKLLKCCHELIKSDKEFLYHKLTYNNNDVEVPSRAVRADESYMEYLICSNGSMQTSTLIFKKEVFDVIEFSEDLKKYQDFDLINKCEANNFKSVFIPEVLTIMDNNPKAVRISNSFDPSTSIYWFEKVRTTLNGQTKNTFIISRIVKYYALSGRKIDAVRYAWNNLSLNLTRKNIFHLSLYVLCPLFVIDMAKKIKHLLLK